MKQTSGRPILSSRTDDTQPMFRTTNCNNNIKTVDRRNVTSGHMLDSTVELATPSSPHHQRIYTSDDEEDDSSLMRASRGDVGSSGVDKDDV